MTDRTGFTIRSDEECLDLLGAYALNALLPAEKTAVEAWLPTSPVCQQELQILRRGVDAYALAVEERDPSPELRNRLWTAINTEPNLKQPAYEPASLPTSQPRPSPVNEPIPITSRKIPVWGRLAAAITLLLAGAGIAWAVLSGQDEADDAVVLGQFVTTDTAEPGTTTTGDVSWDADQNLMRLDLRNLPDLPEGYVYQLWLVTDDGEVLPSVVFGPESDDTTSVAMVADPSGVDVLALTQEPGPIGSVSATTPIFAVADLDTTDIENG